MDATKSIISLKMDVNQYPAIIKFKQLLYWVVSHTWLWNLRKQSWVVDEYFGILVNIPIFCILAPAPKILDPPL